MQRIYKTWFSAAHKIKGHPKCGKIHGHNYKLIVKVTGPGCVWLDFAEIKRIVDSILSKKYDHRSLRDMTAELLADKILEDIRPLLRKVFPPVTKVNIELWETENFGVATDY